MKINGCSFACNIPALFKKQHCPTCGGKLTRQKVSRIVHSDSQEAKHYDFDVADMTVKGNMKFTHIAYFCPVCKKEYRKGK